MEDTPAKPSEVEIAIDIYRPLGLFRQCPGFGLGGFCFTFSTDGKATMDSEYDRYIVVSFVDVTLVLSIGDTVEEAQMKCLSLLVGTRIQDGNMQPIFVGGLYIPIKRILYKRLGF